MKEIFNDSIHFVVATYTDLKENYILTIDCVNKVIDYIQSIVDVPLMLIFDDEKGHKTKKITKKSIDEVVEKLKTKQIYTFGISEYMTRKVYMEELEPNLFYPSLGCTIEIGTVGRNRDIGMYSDGIGLSIPFKLAMQNDNMEKLKDLFKYLCLNLNSVNAYISRGTCEMTLMIGGNGDIIRQYQTDRKD